MAQEILVYTILGPILDQQIILFSAQNTGTFTLSIKVDGDEINGGPLQLDYNNQTSSQPPHSMASPSHNHVTSPNRDHQGYVPKNRHRFKSGNSQNSSNGSFSYQNGSSFQNNMTSNSNMAAYENNISASIQSVTL